MALPSVLVNFTVAIEAINFYGEVKSVTLPKITGVFEEFRSGGMPAGVEIDLGLEVMTMESTFGGEMHEIIKQYGRRGVNALNFRFSGLLENQDTGQTDEIEISARGRHIEIDPSDAEARSLKEFKGVSTLAYYKYTLNGKSLLEVDTLGVKLVVDGVDRLAAARKALKI